jgi:hypothetical protein
MESLRISLFSLILRRRRAPQSEPEAVKLGSLTQLFAAIGRKPFQVKVQFVLGQTSTKKVKDASSSSFKFFPGWPRAWRPGSVGFRR